VDTILIFLTGIGSAYLASRLMKRGPFNLADLVTGIFGGLVGLSLAQIVGVEGAGWWPGTSIFLAFILTLGLESLQHRTFLR
jgi:hypothetical protein